jgi:ATP synthase protein I
MSTKSPEPDDLRALEERLQEMRRREAAKNRKTPPSPMGIAYRFMSELVTALVVSGAIGWGLDRLFGTRPILLIVFVLLGAAAGIRNVVYAANKLNQSTARGAETPAADEDDEEQ